MTTLELALRYLAGGISVIPIALDATKRPAADLLPREPDPAQPDRFRPSWKPYQSRLATEAEARRWWTGPRPAGLAAVCGAVSGGLELIDFDRDADLLFGAWRTLVSEAFDEDLPARLCVVRTPREPAGYHVWFRWAGPVPGNSKLAGDPSLPAGERTLIETRGEGGYALVPGCPLAVHETGRPYVHEYGVALWDLAPISAEERECLIGFARSLDRTPAAPEPPSRLATQDLRPGDDFDARGWDWADLLEPHGWTLVGRVGDERRWARPGKKRGWSATTGHCHSNGADLLRVFTSNADGFDEGRAYGKFRALAILEHRGDLSLAAQDLRRRGFGSVAGPRRAQRDASRAAPTPPHAPAATPRPSLRPIQPYTPFPTDCLPLGVRALVEEGALALGCDSAYVALPALAACAAAIGGSRAIRLKRTWSEPSVLWTAPVGESGTLKTPAYRLAIDPLHAIQRGWIERHREQTAQYQREQEEGETDTARPPVLRRLVCSDVTIEKLAELLEDNPRGVLVARDELSGWFASFSRYKGKGGGSDAPNYLELYSCGCLVYDRKTGDRPLVVVDHAQASMTGNIQPGILGRCLTQEYHDSGLAARLLMAMPPRLTKRWSDADVCDAAGAGYRDLIERLAGLAMRHVDGRLMPDRLELTPPARRAWIAWYDEWALVQAEADDEQAAAYSKIEAVAARLALIHHVCCEVALGRPATAPVPLTSMECGVRLARWFARESRRIHAALRESDGQKQTRRLCEWLTARGGATARDLRRRSPSRFCDADAAEAELNVLVENGLAYWETVPSTEQGGRPTRRCQILTDVTRETDETDETDATDDP